MSTPIPVLTVADGNWSPHIATTLRSVVDCADGAEIELFVGAIAIGAADRERIQRSVGDHPITWLDLPLSWLDQFPEAHSHKSQIARLHTFSALAELRDRAIYVDADVLFNTPVRELWDIDLEGHPMAATRCAFGLWMGRGQPGWVESGRDGRLFYGQTGVMLLDLRAYRETAMLARCEEFLHQIGPELRWADQEVLNEVLAGDWKELPLRWNVRGSDSLLPADLMVCVFGPEERHEAEERPAVVHYAGRYKAWDWSNPDRGELVEIEKWDRTAFSTDYADWYAEQRRIGLEALANARPRKRSVIRRLRRATEVLLHG